MTNLNLTIEVLKQLNQPFEITSQTLIITPTSSPMLECLPGTWVDTNESTQLHIDLLEGPFITPEYVARFIMKVASKI